MNKAVLPTRQNGLAPDPYRCPRNPKFASCQLTFGNLVISIFPKKSNYPFNCFIEGPVSKKNFMLCSLGGYSYINGSNLLVKFKGKKFVVCINN